MRNEQKNFELRRARKHVLKYGFSNMVTLVKAGAKVEHFHISYSNTFLQVVGSRLPQGLGDDTPSALVVSEIASGWTVHCHYVLDPKRLYHLWTADTLPEWASTTRKSNAKTTPALAG